MAEIYIFENNSEEHVFSERYKKKKDQILAAYEELPRYRRSNSMVKVAAALLAVVLISGTAVAYNGDVLESFFKYNGKGKLDTKYQLMELSRSGYDGTELLTSDSENENIDVSVLTAIKGEKTITVALLLTFNDVVLPDIQGYNLMRLSPSTGGENLIGMGKPVNDPFCMGYEEDGIIQSEDEEDLGLAENQVLIYNEYSWDEAVDLSKITGIEMSITRLSALYVAEEDDGYGHYEAISRELLDTDENGDAMEWKLTISLEGDSYMDYSYEINDTIEAFKDEYYIERINVTPTRLSVWLDKDKTEALNDIQLTGADPHIFFLGAGYGDTIEKIYIIMSDGKKLKYRDIGSTASSQDVDDGRLMEDSVWFDVPIDPTQIAGIQIDGQVIMFEDYE